MKKKKIAKTFAKAVILAQKYREKSYDKKAVAKIEKKMKKKYPDSIGMVDYASYYQLSVYEACEKAINKVGLPIAMSYPLYLTMDWGNDISDWSHEVLDKH